MAKRTAAGRAVQVGICLYTGVWASSAALARDLLHIAAAISDARRGHGRMETRYLAERPGDVSSASGQAIHAAASWDGADVDVVILPSRAIPFLEPVAHPPGLASWIGRQHERGCSVLAIATGSWLLAETGLLDGHTSTTHWGCLDRCRDRYPNVDWTSDARLAVTGRIVTARDMSASAVALCHMVGRVLNPAIAERTYQYALIHETGAEALPLLHTVSLRDHGDAQVLAVQDWLEARYSEPISATDAARLVHMSPRNLRRRFLEATGRGLSAYLTDVRLARARALLVSTQEAVAQIAYRVGYADPSTFTALFKQRHGQTPSGYRRALLASAVGGEVANARRAPARR